jgi:UPF0755 protein
LKYISRLFAVVLIGVVLSWYLLWRWESELNLKKATIITLKTSESLASFSEKLEKKALISNAKLFSWIVRTRYDYSKFQAGKYLFEGSVSPKKIINSISDGLVHKQLLFSLTIPEGFSLSQVNSRLEKLGYLSEKSKVIAEILKKWNIGATSLEGYLYPATYNFYDDNPTLFEIYDKMVTEFFKRLPKSFLLEVKNSSFSLQQVVTIASMIEKETGLKDEQNLVSEVIHNRLKRKIPLAIDATLIYGIKNYKGDITFKHLSDRSNKYNSRIYKGLPPTPICSPSLSSLLAALNPTSYGYLFYVTVAGDKDKRHHFSKTLKEHNRFVRKLVEYSKKNK